MFFVQKPQISFLSTEPNKVEIHSQFQLHQGGKVREELKVLFTTRNSCNLVSIPLYLFFSNLR